ncbi:hypothetical protein [Dictyobacter aurantiacus]|uniref:Uncharacterized protein n=1 Tax=Dictyobacter aurantiacus TaxID=1936993 RepID=A0A401ZH08_9CHLR|nr:hypothetical protein [Dictyobacter aurantiacus]GCE06171.1 hypothetical protein KDAU_35000 [Dictyobacter aurantiacus]
MNIYKLLLCLYPRTWRDRYEEEMLMILASRPLSLFDSIDVLGGALDAHLHPRLGTTGLSLTERARLMLLSLRGSLLTIFCAYVGFILAGLGFQKLTESATMQVLTQRDPVISLSFQVILVGAVVALLAVLAGGLPIAVAVIRSALANKRWGLLFLLAVPVLAFIVFLMVIVFLETAHPGSQSPEQKALYGCLILGTLLAAAIVSAGAVCSAVARSEIPGSLLRFAVLPSILTTGTMALILISTIVWGLGLRASVPQIFSGYQGIMRTSTMGTWLGIVIAMAGTTVLAILFVIRSLLAYSMLRKATA